MPIDRYANIATIEVTESAADTLTFQELRTNLGIDSGRQKASAMIIDEIDYFLSTTTLNALDADQDRIHFAVTISNAVADLQDITDRRILHSGFLQRNDGGTAGNAMIFRMPLIYQFFPPLITAERAIFLAVLGGTTAIANVLRVRVYYRTVEISQGEFIELAEVFRLVG